MKEANKRTDFVNTNHIIRAVVLDYDDETVIKLLVPSDNERGRPLEYVTVTEKFRNFNYAKVYLHGLGIPFEKIEL